MTAISTLTYLRNKTQHPNTLKVARLKENSFTRNREMTFPDAVAFIMDMRNTTLQTRLNIYFNQVKGGNAISQQAFSKLRMNFDHSPFEGMARGLVEIEYSGEYELPQWHGYHVFAIDGSTLQLPRVDALREEFGTRGRGNECPCAGVSVLYDVLHGWALDPAITKAAINEREECEKHVEFLEKKLGHIAKNSILLLDRGYPSLDLLSKLQDSGLKFAARCNAQFLREINHAPLGDSVVALRNGRCVRVLKFALPSGEIETLVTNLFVLQEALFPELYAMRWGVETAYFRLKRELCIEKFSGKTPNSIRQDFWASMVLINTVAVFQKEADHLVAERQRGKALKHPNRARCSDLIVTLRDRFIFASLCGYPSIADLEMKDVLETLARVVSPVRPDRHFPRSLRHVPSAHHNLKSHL